MIPLRLMVENFMCYREKTEISFRGSVVWAFSGHNGSGKSTLLDAIRYALYGEHRAGKQKLEALIHRSTTTASSFTIEFDFAIGENEYRIHRTYSQKKKGTVGVFHLNGPDAPYPGRPGPQFVMGKEGFDRWILDNIGLDERAFTVSVLLLQGQSEKLLKLEGSERHDVLAHIIDLSRYETLTKKALEKLKDQEAYVKAYKGQLDGLETIDEACIEVIEQQAREAQDQKEQARLRHLSLVRLKEQARQWLKLQEQEQDLLQKLGHCEQLLAQAEQIERDAERLATLQQVIPPLAQIQQRQTESRSLQRQIELHCERFTSLKASIQKISVERQSRQRHLETVRSSYQQREQEHKRVQSDLLTLQVPCNDIARLNEKQQTYQDLQADLATFAPDLEKQQKRLKDRLDEMSSIEVATPLLQNFAHYRSEWHQTTRHLEKIALELHHRKCAQEQTTTRLLDLRGALEALREQVSQLRSEVASQKTLLTASQERFDRFHTIEGGANCNYCGQPLTPEHLDAERQRLQEELQERKHSLQLCTTRHNAAQQQQKGLERDIKLLEQQEQQQLEDNEKLVEQKNGVLRRREAAYIGAKQQLELLIPAYLERIQGAVGTSVDVDTCFQTTYPTREDLEVLSLCLQNKPNLQQKLQNIESERIEREKLLRKQEYILGEIEQLLQSYPPERVCVLLEERQQADLRERELSAMLEELSRQVGQYEQEIAKIDKEEPDIREEHYQLEQTLTIASTNLKNVQQRITGLQEQIPGEWLEQLPHLSPELLANWQQEINDLQGAEERQKSLIKARQGQDQYRQALASLESEQRQFPEEARCTPKQAQEEINLIDASYQAFEDLERKNRGEAQRLREIQERRQNLQQQWTEAKRLASRYKELSYLLGRDGLQHHLLQNAEEGIIYYANETLDSISGGTLRLELRVSAESKTKALDMVAYNTVISTHEPQSIKLLSGSQQFRVAISLAIGIGRYMGRSNHRVESIMIDEGFGSLDAEGRDEMTQALQALKEDFKRVIVISHQNEFSDKFPNRYETRLVEGQTIITLV